MTTQSDTPGDPRLSFIAMMDQHQESMRTSIAPAVASYLTALVENGLDLSVALVLAKEYQMVLLQSMASRR